MIRVLAFLVLQYTLCLTIRVPIEWNDNSEVQNDQLKNQNVLPVETFATKEAQQNPQKPIPKEYFEYTAKKPQFAVEVANFHGVKSPENLYKAHPVRPHTGVNKPELGKHKILDPRKQIHAPYRQFINNNKHLTHVTPVSTKYNIFHPYKAEEPALKIIYQDPFLAKVQNDVKTTKNRLQLYENSAGESDIKKSEYLESPNETDRKKSPPQNQPTQFEMHKPQRRPIYYMPPISNNNRDNVLNHKIRHPWGQSYGKVTPNHYRPIKNHLHNLRQQHALKYDDEQNEYPQVQPAEIHEEKPDGYDIYEKGKAKFSQLRNNVDESINKAVKENRPSSHQALELQNTSNENENVDDEVEFSPVKNYAQVRKIETVKHVPRDAAFHDAETYEDILNAPRLREAVKSSKAHTIYSEEGYEDAAYDHAGEQKHATDHEGHGGYLKEKESSEGKYKIPSYSGKYEDGKGTSYGDSTIHGEKWKNDDKEKEELKEEDDHSENNSDYFIENDNRSQHEDKENSGEGDSQHGLSKRETNFEVPEINLSTTFPSDDEQRKNSQNKTQADKSDHKLSKYPYYHQNTEAINKHSPLRYAENLKNIPKKTKGGTEFYDSRKQYECPEVDDNVDPIPEKLKKGGHPDDNNEDDDQSIKETGKKQRLKGLGDKIDCFKVKYFGENPLDSPFFEEDLISDPEPIRAPISNIFKFLNERNNPITLETQTSSIVDQDKMKNSEIKANDTLAQKLLLDILISEGMKINDENSNDQNEKKKEISARRKRATPFIYEPYKIIRDSQIQDSKKTTTSSNISPLIKQLQSSRVVDRVTTNLSKDQPVKRNTGSITYKNISKKDREKTHRTPEKETSNSTFVDVNEGLRQGEPRFEQRPLNHKPQYTPIEIKKSITPEAYKIHTNDSNENDKSKSQVIRAERAHKNENANGNREFFDVSKYLPESLELQRPESSNKVKKIKEYPERKPDVLEEDESESQESDEYDEYDDEEEEIVLTTSTTTTSKPTIRKRIRIHTTSSTPRNEEKVDHQVPKLQLITRFRNPTDEVIHQDKVSIPVNEKLKEKSKTTNDDTVIPKYREKKRKSAKSTFVTDTQRYDEGNDDMRKDDIDELIGIKHDMEEYMPNYEKEETKRKLNSKTNYDSDFEIDGRNDDEEEDDSEEDDENDEEGDKTDEDDISDTSNTEDSDESVEDIKVTTPEPTKQTLPQTTVAPESTTSVRRLKIDLKPVISKKKIEIHKDLPNNNNLTQFKQDIKETEIIKEIPRKTSEKNAEILELYKDENLAREVNKIFDVEIFDDDVDLKNGPRHGGNYRSIESIESENTPTATTEEKSNKEPSNITTKVSPSSENETIKQTKRKQERRRQHDNVRTRSTTQRTRRSRGPNPRLRDLNNASNNLSGTKTHGGNLKINQSQNRDNQNKKSEKLIELNEDHDENEGGNGNMHGGNFKSYGSSRSSGRDLHGGNYRSARITQANEHNRQPSRRRKENKEDSSKHMRTNSIAVLDTFARVIPTLTTSAPYILDPSKRMYYYVDS
ncbi:PREDICTED: MATH and LRR domain-containing protein PFE0570w-like [Papilio polytes]|uniref:MATH and LRR domain-containing protein PFE0570w-like n=1 Tax=Papilio polytes TaxID=76194 RepID=UPI000676ADB7|nr:PREDICTED: MATH and LRR domain-containing protein PFE0570w-like [Papilio polytes]